MHENYVSQSEFSVQKAERIKIDLEKKPVLDCLKRADWTKFLHDFVNNSSNNGY